MPYAVALANAASPAAERRFPFYLYFFFSLGERKKEIQKEEKAPLLQLNFSAPRGNSVAIVHQNVVQAPVELLFGVAVACVARVRA